MKFIIPIVIILNLLSGHHFEYSPLTYSGEGVVYDDVELDSMIVPHHNIPMDKLLNMYATASNDAEHIILLSPDHFTNSRRPVLTSKKNWYGAFGVVETNQDLTNSFLKLSFVYEDDEEILVEHGINTHLPLIARYFDADVTVLAVSKQITPDQIGELLRKIPDNSFVIGSVDFSHYFSLEEANTYDMVTENLILNGPYDTFFGMNDAYFDTPGVLYAMMTLNKMRGNTTTIYDKSNSAYYMSLSIPETTSYFFIGFSKE